MAWDRQCLEDSEQKDQRINRELKEEFTNWWKKLPIGNFVLGIGNLFEN